MNEMKSLLPADTSFDQAAARLTIDLGAIVANWKELCRLSGKARTAAVLKADAYGLGAAEVGLALAAAGCRDFFVATPEEGGRLRQVAPEARIFVLNGVWRGVEATVLMAGLIPVLGSMEQYAFVRGAVPDHPYALCVDTGMNRLGLTVAEAAALAADPTVRPNLVLSHLACSDQPQHPMNRRQCESFREVARIFESVESSLSSSGGIFLGPDYHFDLTRPGIALYGGEAVASVQNPMQPVVRAEARILQIRNVRAGEIASYGATHRFERDSRIAIVGAGYADGWHRALSGAGVGLRGNGSPGAFGFVAGERVPMIGRITMDLTTFDIGSIPENRVRAGDYIELFGPNVSLDDAARAAGTIGYELLTSMGPRYARRFL
jgi:alanine racemase